MQAILFVYMVGLESSGLLPNVLYTEGNNAFSIYIIVILHYSNTPTGLKAVTGEHKLKSSSAGVEEEHTVERIIMVGLHLA